MLKHFVEARTCHQDECGGDAECHRVDAELRALLAVARAARTLIGPHPGEAKRATDWDRCARALARLDKVSGRKHVRD